LTDVALSLAALGTASSFAATRITTGLASIYTHHQYIAGFFLLGAFAHGAIYLIRDANLTPGAANNSLRARFVTTLLQYRSAIISHLSAITLFLGFHTLGLYVHNDVMQAFGTPEFEISLSPVFGQWLQVAHGQNVGSLLSCGDVLVHHAIALGLHTTVLVLLKAALNGRSSKLMPDKGAFGYGSIAVLVRVL
jgi:photosystem I P700 chlorophyll a apoprotein A2